MNSHSGKRVQILSDRKSQSNANPKSAMKARVCIVNIEQNTSDSFKYTQDQTSVPSRKFYFMTISHQGPRVTNLELNLYLSSFMIPSTANAEVGTFEFSSSLDPKLESTAMFNLHCISVEQVSFIFITLKETYHISKINFYRSSAKTSAIFSHFEFPQICFKNSGVYFDSIAKAVRQRRFLPEDRVYNIKTERTYSYHEREFLDDLIKSTKANRKALDYVVDDQSNPSQNKSSVLTENLKILNQSNSNMQFLQEQRGRTTTRNNEFIIKSSYQNVPERNSENTDPYSTKIISFRLSSPKLDNTPTNYSGNGHSQNASL